MKIRIPVGRTGCACPHYLWVINPVWRGNGNPDCKPTIVLMDQPSVRAAQAAKNSPRIAARPMAAHTSMMEAICAHPSQADPIPLGPQRNMTKAGVLPLTLVFQAEPSSRSSKKVSFHERRTHARYGAHRRPARCTNPLPAKTHELSSPAQISIRRSRWILHRANRQECRNRSFMSSERIWW